MLARVIGFMVLALSIFHVGAQGIAAQRVDVYKRNSNLATRQIKSLALEGQVIELFSTLACDQDIPIGLELSSQAPDLSDYQLNLREGTLPELLDQFVKQNGKYDWFIENGVVNIFPRGEHRDAFLTEILSLRLKRFSVKKGASGGDLEQLLFTSPEIKALMDASGIEPAGTLANFSGFYIPQLGRNFSLDVSNMTMKEILNQVVKDSPLARIWIVRRDRPAGPLRITVSSRQDRRSP